MIQEKVIFVIPGFRQTPKSKAYKALANVLKGEGYSVKLITIPWKNSTITQNTEYFLKKYKSSTSRNKYILGFSYGAMIAFLASTKISSKGIILCSLSPYFKEDINPSKKTALSRLARLRFDDFLRLHSVKLARSTKSKKVIMLYGTLEARSLISRVKNTFAELDPEKKHIISIRKTDHNIGDKNYLLSIQLASKNLL